MSPRFSLIGFWGVALALCAGQSMAFGQTREQSDAQHAYFEALKARPDFWKGLSLRPQPGVSCTSGGYTLGTVANGDCNPDYATQLTGDESVSGTRHGSTLAVPEARFITYDVDNDRDPHRQDAAKMIIPAFGTRGSLNAGIDAFETLITVASQSIPNIGTYQSYRIDNEILTCDNSIDVNPGASGNQCFLRTGEVYTIRVKRGQFGTTAIPHAKGTAVASVVNGLDPSAQLRQNLRTSDGNSYLFTYDLYFTDSWLGIGAANDTGAKFFQFSVADVYWLETIFPYKGGDSSSGKCAGYDANGGTSTYIGGFWLHSYNNAYTGAASWGESDGRRVGPNVTGTSELQPMGPAAPPNAGFCIKANTWTRFWYRIDQRANDYDVLDVWIADESREPVRVFSGIMLSVYPDGNRPNEISQWWVEGNNTYPQHTLGSVDPFRDRVLYLRNFAALRNPGDVTTILQRPVPGLVPPPLIGPLAPTRVRIVQ